ncbi:hypothetical protein [Serratia proteamaculans]|uniref:Uncharacterized protein n=1 Tax=Serratia proteamaculans TaxID=28151 RepID=A0A5Q2VGK9_SERPR|nr:hypothetical protein [Serratia proteamaculans]QGH62721.1 hypothetical protein GHV41_18670 [Serratia proteamaculans]
MSLESNLELNNQLVAQNNDLLTQLLAAMVGSKTFTADTPHQPKAESTAGKPPRKGPFFWKSLDGLQLGEVSDLAGLEAITEANAGVEINRVEFLQRKEEAEKSKAKTPTLEDQPLPVAVALAALYGADARNPAAAQLSAALAITETATGKERSEQIDALTMALTGVDLAAKLHGAGVFDLALQMLEHWDALPGITERRDYATLLLNTPVAKRADVKPAKPKTTKQKDVAEDPKALFAKAEQLILSLAKGGYRSEAVQILADHSAKKLGEVASEDLPSVIAAAEKALEG